jgi:predicted PurR-regulated permease PerM
MHVRSVLARFIRALGIRTHDKRSGSKRERPSPSAPIDNEPVRPLTGHTPDRLSTATVLLLLAAGIALFVPLVWLFVIPLILAATLAALMYPLYRFLFYRLWYQRVLSSFLCCLLLVVGMLLPAYALVQIAISQGVELYRAVEPSVRQLLEDGVQATWFGMLRETEIGRWLLTRIDWRVVFTSLQSALASLGTTIINRTSAGVFGLVANLFITLFIVFYFLMDGKRIVAGIGNLLPIPLAYKQRIVQSFLRISRATVAGTLIIGAVQGALGGLTLLVFGVDAWLFWGFVMLILSVIPMVGPPFVLLPAGIFQIIQGDTWQGVGIILSSLLIVSSVDNVLRPIVVGRGARMHDLMVFVATLGGLSVFGVSGFIVGPAIASFLGAVIDIYRTEFSTRLQPPREQV